MMNIQFCTVDPIVIRAIDEHPSNEWSQISLTDEGMKTFVNDEHPEKQKLFSEITDDGIVISFNEPNSIQRIFFDHRIIGFDFDIINIFSVIC